MVNIYFYLTQVRVANITPLCKGTPRGERSGFAILRQLIFLNVEKQIVDKDKKVSHDRYSKILNELEEIWEEDQYTKEF